MSSEGFSEQLFLERNFSLKALTMYWKLGCAHGSECRTKVKENILACPTAAGDPAKVKPRVWWATRVGCKPGTKSCRASWVLVGT